MAGLALAALAGAQGEARAENLFDMLFGDNRATRTSIEQRRAAPEPPAQRRATRAPEPAASAPKVAAPSFYDYRPQALTRVDFTRIAPGAAEASGDATATAAPDDPFRAALAQLAGFELLAEKDVADALIEHYTQNPEFVWVSGQHVNARARVVLAVLARAGDYGLAETDYAVSVPSPVFDAGEVAARRAALIRFEMALSARALRYARDAHAGRIDPNKLSGYHDFPEKPMNLKQALGFMARTGDVATYLEKRHPQNAVYRALLAELEALRASKERDIVVDSKTFVRPGQSDPDFAKILALIARDADAAFSAEFGPLLDDHAGSETYARALVPLVKAAQKAHDLNPDGVIGPRTVEAIAGQTKAARIAKVLYTLERLRWHPSELGETRVVINAAAFKAEYVENGAPRLSMRTVVGKTSSQTNFFHDELKYVEFNPYWGVPRSIIVNEMLPKLRRDPGYLDRAGYEVTTRSGKRVSSRAVDWWRQGADMPYYVRQKPGPKNALGELKIMFPNEHAIYMHDTPAKSLFKRDTRTFSHGCVRLADPRAMAAAVLDVEADAVAARIASAGDRPSRQTIERKIPVYVGYYTAWPETAGRIGFYGDVYGRDKRLKRALEKVGEQRAPSS